MSIRSASTFCFYFNSICLNVWNHWAVDAYKSYMLSEPHTKIYTLKDVTLFTPNATSHWLYSKRPHIGSIHMRHKQPPNAADTLVKLATTKKKNNENIYDTYWSLFEWRRREKKSDCRKVKEKYKRTAQTWNFSFVWHFYLRFDRSIFISLSFSGGRKKIRERKILHIPIPLCVWCVRCLSVCFLYVANEE